MSDFQKMRSFMVKCQIQPANVTNADLLAAFETVPREKFVPVALRGHAYGDEDLSLGEGRFLMEPVILARMIQALALKPDQIVLDIGGGTGYSSAILSSLASTVIALEADENALARAGALWQDLGYCNIVSIHGALQGGVPAHAPYDAILINGAVESVPSEILSQLSETGRLVVVIRKTGAGLGEIRLFERDGAAGFSSRMIAQAATPYIAGFAPVPAFHF